MTLAGGLWRWGFWARFGVGGAVGEEAGGGVEGFLGDGFQFVEGDVAGDHLAVEDHGGGGVDVEGFGEGAVGLEGVVDGGELDVDRHAGEVDAGFGGGG